MGRSVEEMNDRPRPRTISQASLTHSMLNDWSLVCPARCCTTAEFTTTQAGLPLVGLAGAGGRGGQNI